jgi:hypothetical protein
MAAKSTTPKPGCRPIILPVDGKISPFSRPECAADIDWAVGWQRSTGY